jgi:NAD(P)-dependent dehydrogenase (short-subunit alcohol dehydrogenase family)
MPAVRTGLSEDMVGTAIFLTSAASSYLTAQTVAVDGGQIGA